eukprot:TRINITY_DN96425_c0_g1_i1.p2 TRINITY_DN96425_c0_g1~~TRINITY_DN96425_c0_g1_i1.p2  ORF type:complete len:219 (-),score=37.04 TRINITY_DN96425_c0_g1_i1:25-681(-)
MPDPGGSYHRAQGRRVLPAADGKRCCHMMYTLFQTSGQSLKTASQLSVGDEVLDSQGRPVIVKWSQVHGKTKRLLVDLYTKQAMLPVTGSHRIETPNGRVVEAKELKKDDLVLVANMGVQPLQRVTKRVANVQVVELEFDEDATVPVYLPTILTKGSVLDTSNAASSNPVCKEESLDNNSSMGVATSGPVESGPCADSDSDSVDPTEPTEAWQTDDGF